jgi:hypothetical protein
MKPVQRLMIVSFIQSDGIEITRNCGGLTAQQHTPHQQDKPFKGGLSAENWAQCL